jgi:hypothetical protein
MSEFSSEELAVCIKVLEALNENPSSFSLLAEDLRRKLEKGEIVHHIDGDKRNNNIENLFLTTPAEHNKLHGSSEQLIFELFKLGIVSFDRETARYYITQTYVQSQ